MKIFAYRPEISCTTSCYCSRSWVNSGTTCKRNMWKRAECSAQNQRDQGTAKAVWFSQATLPNIFPINCSFSPKTGVQNVVLTDVRLPYLHTLWPTPCPWCPVSRACPVLQRPGSPEEEPVLPAGSWHTLESLPCRALGTQSNDPTQGTSSSYSQGFCNVQTATESTRKFLQLAF